MLSKVHQRRLRILGWALSGAAVAVGCASDDGVDSLPYGDSVRRMVEIQTADPQRGARGMDGAKAAVALEAYRQDEADLETVDATVLSLGPAGRPR